MRLGLRLFSRLLPAAAVAAVSTNAFAEGEACLRDPECVASEHCYEGVCAPSKAAPEACSKADWSACQDWDVCVDEACKRDDPVCRNALGECFIGEELGECRCANAPGIEWTGEPPDVGSQSDDPTGQCFDLLAATCPQDVPEPECASDDQRERCEAFVGQENALNGACGGQPHDDPARIASAVELCCGEFTESGVAVYRECVLDLDPDDCAGFDACAGAEPGDPTDDMPTGGADPEDDDADDVPASANGDPDDEAALGCRIGGPGPAALGLLVLLGLVGRGRRAQ